MAILHTIERDGKTIAWFVYESDRDAALGLLAEVHENMHFTRSAYEHGLRMHEQKLAIDAGGPVTSDPQQGDEDNREGEHLLEAAHLADTRVDEQLALHPEDTAWLEVECSWCGRVTRFTGKAAVETYHRYVYESYESGVEPHTELNSRFKIEGPCDAGCTPPGGW